MLRIIHGPCEPRIRNMLWRLGRHYDGIRRRLRDTLLPSVLAAAHSVQDEAVDQLIPVAPKVLQPGRMLGDHLQDWPGLATINDIEQRLDAIGLFEALHVEDAHPGEEVECRADSIKESAKLKSEFSRRFAGFDHPLGNFQAAMLRWIDRMAA